MNKEYFKALCEVVKIPVSVASRIIDGRYKPYLSALDDRYYEGSDVWTAKTNALNVAIKSFGKEETEFKLNQL